MCAVGVPPETGLENTALEYKTPSGDRWNIECDANNGTYNFFRQNVYSKTYPNCSSTLPILVSKDKRGQAHSI